MVMAWLHSVSHYLVTIVKEREKMQSIILLSSKASNVFGGHDLEL